MDSAPVRLALTCKAKGMSLEKTLNLEFSLYGYLYAISATLNKCTDLIQEKTDSKKENKLLTLIQLKKYVIHIPR